jgi:hypothetical protein
MHGYDVRVLEVDRHARLALEALAERRVAGELRRDDLQRDAAVVCQFASLVDETHAPARDHRVDAVAGEYRANC